MEIPTFETQQLAVQEFVPSLSLDFAPPHKEEREGKAHVGIEQQQLPIQRYGVGHPFTESVSTNLATVTADLRSFLL